MLHGLLGGALIGLAATLYWISNGRVAGISGILRGAFALRGGSSAGSSRQRREAGVFLVGLVAAGMLAAALGWAPRALAGPPVGLLLVAGLLVGFGTRLGGGCTSGHGVCGLSRLSWRSLVATLVFMATGACTVFVVGHLFPGWGVR